MNLKGSLSQILKNPIWRVVFFCLTFCLANLILIALVFLIAYFFFSSRQISPLWILIALYPMWFALVFFFRRKIEKRDVKSLGFSSEGWFKYFVLGLLSGSLIIAFIFFVNLLMGEIAIKSYGWAGGRPLIIKSLLFFTAVAFMEEIIFRGYIFQNLLEGANPFWAITISSLLFALGHIINAGLNPLGIFNIFLFGVFLCLIYILLRNLWFPVGFHLTWNFFQGNIFGFPIYNLPSQSYFQITRRAGLYTGGGFGPEGSILCTMILATMILILSYLIDWRVHRFIMVGEEAKVDLTGEGVEKEEKGEVKEEIKVEKEKIQKKEEKVEKKEKEFFIDFFDHFS